MTTRTEFTEKQREYIKNADKRWNFKVGATRSGKTFVDVRHIIPRRLRERAGKPGLAGILGVTRETVERNVLSPMRELFGEALVGTINGRGFARVFGENVYCLGAEKACQAAKLRGASFKYVYGDEVTEWSRDVFEMLKSRLDKPYSVFDGVCNPEGPNHWLNRFLLGLTDLGDAAYIQRYTIFDNPYLPEAFVSAITREYAGTVYYSRFLMGEWAAADGLVYPMFDTARHVADGGGGRYARFAAAVDYGVQNPTAMLLFGQTDLGRWRCVDEYYHDGRGSGRILTDEDYYDALRGLIERHSAGSRLERVIIDPSAASFKALIRRKGEYAVKNADNAVLDGIRNCCSAFNNDRVIIDKKCVHLIDELMQYSWDTAGGAERPLKERDHTCDAFRYFVRTMRVYL